MSKKKIIFYTDSLIMGGAEKIAMDYLNLLNEIGKYEILLLINEDNGEKGNILIKEIPKNIEYKFLVSERTMFKLNYYKNLRKKYKIFKLFYTYYRKKRRFEKKKIIKILKEEKYDYLIDFYNILPNKILDKRTVAWQHTTMISKINDIKFKKNLEEKLNKIKKLILINNEMKEEINKFNINFTKNNIEVIYNFFDIGKIIKLSLRQNELSLKEKFLIEKEYFFACSRLDRNKDIPTLIEAYKILKENYGIKEKLYIAGIGDEKERLENLVKKYNLENDIIFLGLQRNPYVWMKNARFFIHSSHREGFGMVLVEALITNGMVISSDCPVGPREILENGKVGVLFPVGNKEKLVEEILKILEDKELIENYRKEAERKIEDFSKEKIKERIEELFI